METKAFVRLRSSRAPYTRGGISFRSTREPVEIERALLTDAQMARLKSDAAIKVDEYTVDMTDEAAPASEMHVVQSADIGSLAPQAGGVILGGAATAGATVGDRLPLDRMEGAVVDQAEPAGADALAPGVVADVLQAESTGETAEVVTSTAGAGDGFEPLPGSVKNEDGFFGAPGDGVPKAAIPAGELPAAGVVADELDGAPVAKSGKGAKATG